MKRTAGRLNVSIALASLVISVMLWMVVLPEQLTRKTRRFSIHLSRFGLDPKQFYVVKAPDSITVQADLSDQQYADLTSKAKAEVDFTSAAAGTHTYNVSIFPDDLLKRLSDAQPRVACTLEPMVHRFVPVSAISTGKLSDSSLILDDLRLETKKVDLDGPASEVARIVKAQGTLRLDMIDPRTPQPIDIQLEPFDADDHVVANVKIDPQKITVTPKLAPSPENKQVFVEAEFTGKVPEGYRVTGYRIDPDRVTASGPNRILKGITKVSTLPIDLSQLTSSQTLTIGLNVPPDVSGLAIREVRVSIKIEAMAVKNLNPPTSVAKTDPPVKTNKDGGLTSGGTTGR